MGLVVRSGMVPTSSPALTQTLMVMGSSPFFSVSGSGSWRTISPTAASLASVPATTTWKVPSATLACSLACSSVMPTSLGTV